MSTEQGMNKRQIERVLKDVIYKDWSFKILTEDSRHLLQVVFVSRCAVTGEEEIQKGRKWLLSTYMTKSEIVQTALKAVLAAEEHETRESFRYKGSAVFGPHFDVDKLVAICGNSLDIRSPI